MGAKTVSPIPGDWYLLTVGNEMNYDVLSGVPEPATGTFLLLVLGLLARRRRVV